MSELTTLVTQALTDPFRIVLLAGLVLTQRRTAATTGLVLPLAAGCIFVAVLLPMAMRFGAEYGLAKAVGAGLVANVILLAPMLLAAYLWDRRRR